MTDADKQKLADLARRLIRARGALAGKDRESPIENLVTDVDKASGETAKAMHQMGLSFAVVDGRVLQLYADDWVEVSDENAGVEILP